MGTFLQILLAVFVVIVALIAAVFFWIKNRMRRAMGDFSAANHLLEKFSLRPARIHLRSGDPYHTSDAFESLAEEIREQGFQRIADLEDHGGAYQIVLATRHRELPIAAAVFEDFSQNVGFVFFAIDTDRQVVGNGNSPSEEIVAGRVDWQMSADATPASALADLQSRLSERCLSFDLKLFRAVFEQVYALRIDRQIARRPTLESVQAVAADAQDPATEEQIQTTYDIIIDHWRLQLDDAILDRFRRTSKIDAVEWEELEDDIRVVHDRLSMDEIADIVAFDEVGEKVFHQCVAQSLTGVALFDAVNERLPNDRQLLRVGEVERPIRAFLYAPNEEIESDVDSSRQYVYEASDPDDEITRGSIFATSGRDAKRQLAELGLQNIKILSEPYPFPGADYDELLLDDKSAEIFARSTTAGTFESILRATASNWWIWLPPTVLAAKSVLEGTPYSWGDYASFGYAAIAGIAMLFLIGPVFFYDQLLHAQLKANPKRAHFWIALLGLTGRFVGMTPELLAVERCKALAEEGKLDEALNQIEEVRNGLGEEAYQTARSSIFSIAGDWDSMMEAQRAYLAEAPAKETATVDLALSIARYSDDVDSADSMIQSIRPSDLPEIGLIGYQYVKGLVAAHRGEHREALANYAKAVEVARQFDSMPIMVGLIAEINGYAALAYKRSGNAESAKQLWAQVISVIRPHRSSDRLIEAYESEKDTDR